MSSNSIAVRVFRASRALLAPAKSSTSAASTASKSSAAAAKPKLKPSNTSPKAAAAAAAKKKPAKESSRLTGIMKPVPLSPQLRSFMGVNEASRVDAVKQIWAYVKLKNLQFDKAFDLENPADKKEIYCDDKLKGIFDGKEKVGFLEIGRFLSRHFIKSH